MTATSSPTEVDLVIQGGSVVTMNSARHIISDGAVAVKGTTIVAVGKREEINRKHRAKRVIGSRDDIVTPGFIDAHNHPIHFATKGATDDMQFQPRFKNIIVPYEHGLTEEDTYLNSCATFVEMISNGTTCFNNPGSLHEDAVGRAAQEVGLRGILAYEAADKGGGLWEDLPWQEVLAQSEAVVEKWNGAADGRLRAWFSLNNPHRVSDELCLAVKERAAKHDVNIHGHVTMPKAVAQAPGFQSPIQRYHRLGLLSSNLYLVHLVHVLPQDIELMAANNVRVVHCPGRSLLGAGGVFATGTIPELIAAGVLMALGSDAGAVSRFLDMVRQMYLAATGHKDARLDATLVGAYKAFEMCTVDAARAMRWEEEIGSLEAGKRADINVLDTSVPEMHPNPHLNPIPNLIYSGSGAITKTTLIDGQIVMEDRHIKTIDVPGLMKELGKAAPEMLGGINAKVESRWPIL
jgi:5-methylthioadenosine/S-adenosylhomocysteine deaminase